MKLYLNLSTHPGFGKYPDGTSINDVTSGNATPLWGKEKHPDFYGRVENDDSQNVSAWFNRSENGSFITVIVDEKQTGKRTQESASAYKGAPKNTSRGVY